ncbi:MAG: dehydrogenase [Microbacterium sp.]|uniref:dehydrogenase n=1 Tax=Microbacterium sp. TaxID=51671 RepID=UPI003A876499
MDASTTADAATRRAVPAGADAASTLADTSPMHPPHAAAECPQCFTELQRDRDWWQARPDNARLVGLVVARPDMPSVVQQREDLARFGVPIEGFRHPAPETLESWETRLVRLFGTLHAGDIVVVANVHALGRTLDEETRTVAVLRERGITVKVLDHSGRHLFDSGR